MAKILVCGLITIETTLRVRSFPIDYAPVDYPFFGIDSSVSGVGYNVAKALSKLSNRIRLLSLVGKDSAAKQVYETLSLGSIPATYVLDRVAQTAQSVIMFDQEGRSQIHVDLKNIQRQDYPVHHFEQAMITADLLALCNINFSRPFLKAGERSDKLIATDVHAVSDLEDDFNRDFMQAADILFMSDELLPVAPEEWAKEVMQRYGPRILVIGLAEKGALLAVKDDDFVDCFPAMETRPVVNTIGGGDALFAAFLHSYMQSSDPYESIKKALLYASHKIGAATASEGFLTNRQLQRLYAEHQQ